MQSVSGKRLFFVTTILMILGFFSVGLSSTGYYVQQDRDQDYTCSHLKILQSYLGRMYDGELVTVETINDMRDRLSQQGIYCKFPDRDSCSLGKSYCDRYGNAVTCIPDDNLGILIPQIVPKPYRSSECLDGEWVQPFMG